MDGGAISIPNSNQELNSIQLWIIQSFMEEFQMIVGAVASKSFSWDLSTVLIDGWNNEDL